MRVVLAADPGESASLALQSWAGGRARPLLLGSYSVFGAYRAWRRRMEAALQAVDAELQARGLDPAALEFFVESPPPAQRVRQGDSRKRYSPGTWYGIGFHGGRLAEGVSTLWPKAPIYTVRVDQWAQALTPVVRRKKLVRHNVRGRTPWPADGYHRLGEAERLVTGAKELFKAEGAAATKAGTDAAWERVVCRAESMLIGCAAVRGLLDGNAQKVAA